MSQRDIILEASADLSTQSALLADCDDSQELSEIVEKLKGTLAVLERVSESNVPSYASSATSRETALMTDEELAADFYMLICPDCKTVYQWDGVDYHRGCRVAPRIEDAYPLS